MTVRQVEQSMPARELEEWMVRGALKPLWPRRLEKMLAQVCLWMARSQGHSHITLDDLDFYADRTVEVRDAEDKATGNAMMLSGLAGVGFKVLGKGVRKPRAKAVH